VREVALAITTKRTRYLDPDAKTLDTARNFVDAVEELMKEYNLSLERLHIGIVTMLLAEQGWI
jgi:hypothetical protein